MKSLKITKKNMVVLSGNEARLFRSTLAGYSYGVRRIEPRYYRINNDNGRLQFKKI